MGDVAPGQAFKGLLGDTDVGLVSHNRNSFFDSLRVRGDDPDAQSQEGSTNLVQMALSQEPDDTEGSIAAVAEPGKGSWLVRWWLNGAEDDDGSDPNGDIQVVIPRNEEEG